LGETKGSGLHGNTQSALEAFTHGFTPIPIRDGGKSPYGSAWTQLSWDSKEQVEASFERWATSGATGVGLLLGKRGGNLVDVDLDHPAAWRLREHFMPYSAMQTGRPGNTRSHRWYVVTKNLPATKQYRMPDGAMGVELRSTGAQTLIPPSVHPSGEQYRWEGTKWGGRTGPAKVDGRVLSVQVALLGMGAVLLDAWPERGGRHEAYLALAGGLLRFGNDGVHPYWEKNLPIVIEALADATHDEDGPETRVAEVMRTTMNQLRTPEGRAIGFPKLGELIGVDHAELVRRRAREVQSLAGWQEPEVTRLSEDYGLGEAVTSTLPPEVRNPIEERVTSWAAVDLEPYLAGEVKMPAPSLLIRTDGHGLMYQGRVNSLFGQSESAKSWLAGFACVQEIGAGGKSLYVDCEDTPEGTIDRFRRLGLGDDDLRHKFRYVNPEGPISSMERSKFGTRESKEGKAALGEFEAMLVSFNPTLIVVDGMTTLYALHGLDTNDAMSTEIVTGWLKSLCRGGTRTVIVIDHTGKSSGPGASPIGAHHKVAMVQGTALRVDVIDRPLPGKVGQVMLTVFKDRPGAVRLVSLPPNGDDEQVAGVVTVDSTVEGITKISVDPGDPEDVNLTERHSSKIAAEMAKVETLRTLGEAIVTVLEGQPRIEYRLAQIEVLLDHPSDGMVGDACKLLEGQGRMMRNSPRGQFWRLLDPSDTSPTK